MGAIKFALLDGSTVIVNVGGVLPAGLRPYFRIRIIGVENVLGALVSSGDLTTVAMWDATTAALFTGDILPASADHLTPTYPKIYDCAFVMAKLTDTGYVAVLLPPPIFYFKLLTESRERGDNDDDGDMVILDISR